MDGITIYSEWAVAAVPVTLNWTVGEFDVGISIKIINSDREDVVYLVEQPMGFPETTSIFLIPGSYIVEAGDENGDGWNGGSFTITNDNTGEMYSIFNSTTDEEKDFFTLDSGSSAVGSFDIPNYFNPDITTYTEFEDGSVPVTLNWTVGVWDDEISFKIINSATKDVVYICGEPAISPGHMPDWYDHAEPETTSFF